MFNRLIAFMVAAFIMLAAIQPAMAVDKKKKEEPVKSKITLKKQQPEKVKRPAQSSTKVKAKKFNKFVDKNKNGIDDRRENLRTKKVAPKPSSTKANNKKKVSTKKKDSKAKKDSTKKKK